MPIHLPADPIVWIALIVVAGLVLGLTVWLGRGMKIRKSKDEFSLDVEREPATGRRAAGIQVAQGVPIEDAQVGDIAGVKTKGGAPPPDISAGVEVLKKGKIKGASVGDIVGFKQEGGATGDKT